MVITHNTAAEIDTQVLTGCSIGYYGKDDDMSQLPRMLGDWNIRTVGDTRSPGCGYIVAVPSNARTRVIYTERRIVWLKALGFPRDLAERYLKASVVVSRRWDHEVATFVLDNIKIDEYVLDLMLSAENPKKVGTKHDVHTRSSRGKVLAGCQILKNLLIP